MKKSPPVKSSTSQNLQLALRFEKDKDDQTVTATLPQTPALPVDLQNVELKFQKLGDQVSVSCPNRELKVRSIDPNRSTRVFWPGDLFFVGTEIFRMTVNDSGEWTLEHLPFHLVKRGETTVLGTHNLNPFSSPNFLANPRYSFSPKLIPFSHISGMIYALIGEKSELIVDGQEIEFDGFRFKIYIIPDGENIRLGFSEVPLKNSDREAVSRRSSEVQAEVEKRKAEKEKIAKQGVDLLAKSAKELGPAMKDDQAAQSVRGLGVAPNVSANSDSVEKGRYVLESGASHVVSVDDFLSAVIGSSYQRTGDASQIYFYNQSGKLTVFLPDSPDWRTIEDGSLLKVNGLVLKAGCQKLESGEIRFGFKKAVSATVFDPQLKTVRKIDYAPPAFVESSDVAVLAKPKKISFGGYIDSSNNRSSKIHEIPVRQFGSAIPVGQAQFKDFVRSLGSAADYEYFQVICEGLEDLKSDHFFVAYDPKENVLKVIARPGFKLCLKERGLSVLSQELPNDCWTTVGVGEVLILSTPNGKEVALEVDVGPQEGEFILRPTVDGKWAKNRAFELSQNRSRELNKEARRNPLDKFELGKVGLQNNPENGSPEWPEGHVFDLSTHKPIQLQDDLNPPLLPVLSERVLPVSEYAKIGWVPNRDPIAVPPGVPIPLGKLQFESAVQYYKSKNHAPLVKDQMQAPLEELRENHCFIAYQVDQEGKKHWFVNSRLQGKTKLDGLEVPSDTWVEIQENQNHQRSLVLENPFEGQACFGITINDGSLSMGIRYDYSKKGTPLQQVKERQTPPKSPSFRHVPSQTKGKVESATSRNAFNAEMRASSRPGIKDFDAALTQENPKMTQGSHLKSGRHQDVAPSMSKEAILEESLSRNPATSFGELRDRVSSAGLMLGERDQLLRKIERFENFREHAQNFSVDSPVLPTLLRLREEAMLRQHEARPLEMFYSVDSLDETSKLKQKLDELNEELKSIYQRSHDAEDALIYRVLHRGLPLYRLSEQMGIRPLAFAYMEKVLELVSEQFRDESQKIVQSSVKIFENQQGGVHNPFTGELYSYQVDSNEKIDLKQKGDPKQIEPLYRVASMFLRSKLGMPLFGPPSSYEVSSLRKIVKVLPNTANVNVEKASYRELQKAISAEFKVFGKGLRDALEKSSFDVQRMVLEAAMPLFRHSALPPAIAASWKMFFAFQLKYPMELGMQELFPQQGESRHYLSVGELGRAGYLELKAFFRHNPLHIHPQLYRAIFDGRFQGNTYRSKDVLYTLVADPLNLGGLASFEGINILMGLHRDNLKLHENLKSQKKLMLKTLVFSGEHGDLSLHLGEAKRHGSNLKNHPDLKKSFSYDAKKHSFSWWVPQSSNAFSKVEAFYDADGNVRRVDLAYALSDEVNNSLSEDDKAYLQNYIAEELKKVWGNTSVMVFPMPGFRELFSELDAKGVWTPEIEEIHVSWEDGDPDGDAAIPDTEPAPSSGPRPIGISNRQGVAAMPASAMSQTPAVAKAPAVISGPKNVPTHPANQSLEFADDAKAIAAFLPNREDNYYLNEKGELISLVPLEMRIKEAKIRKALADLCPVAGSLKLDQENYKKAYVFVYGTEPPSNWVGFYQNRRILISKDKEGAVSVIEFKRTKDDKEGVKPLGVWYPNSALTKEKKPELSVDYQKFQEEWSTLPTTQKIKWGVPEDILQKSEPSPYNPEEWLPSSAQSPTPTPTPELVSTEKEAKQPHVVIGGPSKIRRYEVPVYNPDGTEFETPQSASTAAAIQPDSMSGSGTGCLNTEQAEKQKAENLRKVKILEELLQRVQKNSKEPRMPSGNSKPPFGMNDSRPIGEGQGYRPSATDVQKLQIYPGQIYNIDGSHDLAFEGFPSFTNASQGGVNRRASVPGYLMFGDDPQQAYQVDLAVFGNGRPIFIRPQDIESLSESIRPAKQTGVQTPVSASSMLKNDRDWAIRYGTHGGQTGWFFASKTPGVRVNGQDANKNWVYLSPMSGHRISYNGKAVDLEIEQEGFSAAISGIRFKDPKNVRAASPAYSPRNMRIAGSGMFGRQGFGKAFGANAPSYAPVALGSVKAAQLSEVSAQKPIIDNFSSAPDLCRVLTKPSSLFPRLGLDFSKSSIESIREAVVKIIDDPDLSKILKNDWNYHRQMYGLGSVLFSTSGIGDKDVNEDRGCLFRLPDGTIVMVALDGLGGSSDGARAANIAAIVIEAAMRQGLDGKEALKLTNRVIVDDNSKMAEAAAAASNQGKQTGFRSLTTATVTVLKPDQKGGYIPEFLTVGDSDCMVIGFKKENGKLVSFVKHHTEFPSPLFEKKDEVTGQFGRLDIANDELILGARLAPEAHRTTCLGLSVSSQWIAQTTLKEGLRLEKNDFVLLRSDGVTEVYGSYRRFLAVLDREIEKQGWTDEDEVDSELLSEAWEEDIFNRQTQVRDLRASQKEEMPFTDVVGQSGSGSKTLKKIKISYWSLNPQTGQREQKTSVKFVIEDQKLKIIDAIKPDNCLLILHKVGTPLLPPVKVAGLYSKYAALIGGTEYHFDTPEALKRFNSPEGIKIGARELGVIGFEMPGLEDVEWTIKSSDFENKQGPITYQSKNGRYQFKAEKLEAGGLKLTFLGEQKIEIENEATTQRMSPVDGVSVDDEPTLKRPSSAPQQAQAEAPAQKPQPVEAAVPSPDSRAVATSASAEPIATPFGPLKSGQVFRGLYPEQFDPKNPKSVARVELKLFVDANGRLLFNDLSRKLKDGQTLCFPVLDPRGVHMQQTKKLHMQQMGDETSAFESNQIIQVQPIRLREESPGSSYFELEFPVSVTTGGGNSTLSHQINIGVIFGKNSVVAVGEKIANEQRLIMPGYVQKITRNRRLKEFEIVDGQSFKVTGRDEKGRFVLKPDVKGDNIALKMGFLPNGLLKVSYAENGMGEGSDDVVSVPEIGVHDVRLGQMVRFVDPILEYEESKIKEAAEKEKAAKKDDSSAGGMEQSPYEYKVLLSGSKEGPKVLLSNNIQDGQLLARDFKKYVNVKVPDGKGGTKTVREIQVQRTMFLARQINGKPIFSWVSLTPLARQKNDETLEMFKDASGKLYFLDIEQSSRRRDITLFNQDGNIQKFDPKKPKEIVAGQRILMKKNGGYFVTQIREVNQGNGRELQPVTSRWVCAKLGQSGLSEDQFIIHLDAKTGEFYLMDSGLQSEQERSEIVVEHDSKNRTMLKPLQPQKISDGSVITISNLIDGKFVKVTRRVKILGSGQDAKLVFI